MLPKMLPKKPKIGMPERIRSPGHLNWIRRHACCVSGCDGLPIEAAHVRTGTGGGTSIKPGDDWAISLCQMHHREQHQIGEARFSRKYKIDMKSLAQEFARKSPVLRRKK